MQHRPPNVIKFRMRSMSDETVHTGTGYSTRDQIVQVAACILLAHHAAASFVYGPEAGRHLKLPDIKRFRLVEKMSVAKMQY
eukprot:1161604-Pelagomonas_calceolata.AAC.5